VALGLVVAVHVATLNGVDVEAAHPDVWLLHYGALVAIPVALVVAVRMAAPGRRLRDLMRLMPLPARVAIVGLLLYATASFFIIVPMSGGGAPVLRDGHFFLNDHGVMHALSEEAFHARRSLVLRGFSALWLYLYFVAAVYLLLARKKP
jgi:hypothetical protein